MKNFFHTKNISKIALLSILLVGFVLPSVTFAVNDAKISGPGSGDGGSIKTEQKDGTVVETKVDGSGTKTAPSVPESSGCGAFSPFQCIKEAFYDTFAWFLYGIMTICAFILGIAGLLLKEVMDYTVVGMSSRIASLGTLNVAWSAFRDLANMLFIFILLYIAIETILDRMGGNTKKMLVRVVIIGLLINFSLFFTKIIIDGSNIVTIGFYNNILIGSTDAGGWEKYGLAGPFVDKMKLTGAYDKKALATFGPMDMTLIALGGSLVMLVAAFMFLAMAFLFIGRFVVLVFLMILSPLAFASVALPEDKYSKMWWDKLIDQCIFAPVFMALLWVTLLLLDGILPKTTGNFATSLGGGTTPSVDSLSIIMNFIVIIAMLVFCLIAAKQLGAAGASSVMKAGKDLQKWGQGKVVRGALRPVGLAERALTKAGLDKGIFGRNILAASGMLTNNKLGGDKSLRDRFKEKDQNAAKYAESTDSRIVNANAKKMEKDRVLELKNLEDSATNPDSLAHKKQQEDTAQISKNASEAAWNAQVTAGTVHGKQSGLEAAKRDLTAKQAAATANPTLVSNPAHMAAVADLEQKIANTERLKEEKDKIKLEHQKKKLEREIAESRIKDIKNKVGPATQEEVKSLETMRKAKVEQLDGKWFKGVDRKAAIKYVRDELGGGKAGSKTAQLKAELAKL